MSDKCNAIYFQWFSLLYCPWYGKVVKAALKNSDHDKGVKAAYEKNKAVIAANKARIKGRTHKRILQQYYNRPLSPPLHHHLIRTCIHNNIHNTRIDLHH
jgi:hypothetical protein